MLFVMQLNPSIAPAPPPMLVDKRALPAVTGMHRMLFNGFEPDALASRAGLLLCCESMKR